MTVPPLPIGRAPSSYWRTAERMERLHQLPRRHRLHPSGGFLIVSRETPRRSLRGEYSAVAVHLLLQVDDPCLLASRQDLEGMRPLQISPPRLLARRKPTSIGQEPGEEYNITWRYPFCGYRRLAVHLVQLRRERYQPFPPYILCPNKRRIL